ncbi:MAG: stimulus-sensing domain-containing protein [Alphaproteobacteria bacterium]|nr:stimulus-sensing domain-containing protein [Alphaproteobacteria bacterium]
MASGAAPAPRRRRRGLTRLIIALNLIALFVLIAGTFWLNVRRVGMIDERILSLKTQGAIIAAALAESATRGPESMEIDEQLAVPLMQRLVARTNARVRLFDRRGQLQIDSRIIVPSNEVVTSRLPPPDSWLASEWVDGIYEWLARWAPGADYPPYQELQGPDGTFYGEVADALQANASSAIRVNSTGDLILSVAVPVQRYQLVLGVLHLTNEGGDIGAILRQERLAILQLSLIAIGVMIATSVLMARNIARPIRALADAADDARTRSKGRVAIPDFGRRRDEIGELSNALTAMTGALYDRIDAIEQFAADVAHEIKNPLTSLKSAVETMRRATPEQRERLMAVIEDDVRRVNRLVSDISDASRLDAELAREKAGPVDLARLAREVAQLCEQDDGPKVVVEPDLGVQRSGLVITGLEGPLGQVLRNLIDNAMSFSPPDGIVKVMLKREGRFGLMTVEDDGPGIPPEHLEDVFKRFYTSRPEEHFGRNSGLGLSISRQIVDVHDGTIRAANKPGATPGTHGGAIFTVRLPLP